MSRGYHWKAGDLVAVISDILIYGCNPVSLEKSFGFAPVSDQPEAVKDENDEAIRLEKAELIMRLVKVSTGQRVVKYPTGVESLAVLVAPILVSDDIFTIR
jgi:hypothetical protein